MIIRNAEPMLNIDENYLVFAYMETQKMYKWVTMHTYLIKINVSEMEKYQQPLFIISKYFVCDVL